MKTVLGKNRFLFLKTELEQHYIDDENVYIDNFDLSKNQL